MAADWKDYEKQIFKQLKDEYPKADVAFNVYVAGKESKTKRQIDILINRTEKRKKYLGLAECKYFNRKVDIGRIDSLVGKMMDIHADFGLIFSALGFTKGAEQYASKANISFRQMPFEFLKDFGFVNSNELDSDIFIQETEYIKSFCSKCNVTNLYEIKIIRGFADSDEDIICPECKTPHVNTRTDGGYKVIKRFKKKEVTESEVDNFITEHLLKTRPTWDKKYLIEWEYGKHLLEDQLCFLCHKELSESFPSSFRVNYGGYLICNECYMSKRTLLIDNNKV